ncbi:MAG: SulP family inorganic anion transporter [Proteobacteria bacterium]|jgi:sulfate permease, SulP family|nr:SulP family inorganic anion transporter [Pseudomonadota bacterium]MBT5065701.1 SulP family inorganic anion transporter [Pseudomonadota bacterium]MBT6192716.1 SulP family inorganic anion transporter [Pseudomonadota bacterium]MBT6675348.1 SulP family inorganic anion transporter [Pseudomonadota bacterium]MBT7246780.1 SulP family inorganic anion transporter [Pseudomonadota bacterium]
MNSPDIKINLLSGLTVALAMVPEAIAFALIAHVSPLTGLYAAIIVCFITSLFGGRPGMISGATGALAVVMVALVARHGVEYLFATVVLMGVLQTIFALLRLGKYIRMVPYPVMLGFVNGLAIVIFIAQFSHFKEINSDGVEIWLSGAPLNTMLVLTGLTVAIIYFFPKITKAVPSSLAAIFIVSSIVFIFGLNTKTVGDLGSIAGTIPSFKIPEIAYSLDDFKTILPYAFLLACIGLIETLLTLNLIDDMTNTRGRPNKESLAQGCANIITGFFGGMGGCAMIGQSMININNGALSRISGIATAVFLTSFILFFSQWIELIPLAALIGVMFVVAEKTFEWGSLRLFGKIPRKDIFVGLLVGGVTIVADLAIAVILGVIVSALFFAWSHAKRIQVDSSVDDNGWKTYALEGTLFFASTKNFHELFSIHDDPTEVVIDFKKSLVADHSAIMAIDSLASKYKFVGKNLHLMHLSPDCLKILDTAKSMVEINLLEDRKYHIAEVKLS